MKTIHIVLLSLALAILPLGIVIWFVSHLTPGVDNYAEYYQIKAEEKALIQAIEEFKKANQIYKVPDYYQVQDGREDSEEHRYDVYFYYKEEECVIHCWTHQSGIKRTTFALLAAKTDKWRRINKEMAEDESEQQKTLFETRILNPIKRKLSETY